MPQIPYILQTPLGQMAIHANDEAINVVSFIKKGNEVNSSLENNIDHPLVNKCVTQLNEYFAGTRKFLTCHYNKMVPGFNKVSGTSY